MDSDLRAASAVFERWARHGEHRRPPLELACATWILQRAGALSLEEALPGNRPFILAARDFLQGPKGWDTGPWTEALRGMARERQVRMCMFCEPLLSRLEPRRAWEAMRAVVPEEHLLESGGIGMHLAVQWRRREPGDDWTKHLARPPPRPALEVISAELLCFDALSDDPAVREALCQRITRHSRKQLLSMRSEVRGTLLTALALADPARAYAISRDAGSPWPTDDTGADARYLMARWLAGQGQAAAALEAIEAQQRLAYSCEWLSAMARAGALEAEVLERKALECVPRLPEWLEARSWPEALFPLCQVAARLGAVSIVEAICRLEVPGHMLMGGLMAVDFTRLERERPGQTRAFLERLGGSEPFHQMPWYPEGPPLLGSPGECLEALRVVAASPVGFEQWLPLSELCASDRVSLP